MSRLARIRRLAYQALHGALVVGCVAVVLMGLSRFLPPEWRSVELLCHLQWQYFLCTVFALVVALLFRMRAGTVVAVAAVVLQSLPILPLYVGGPSADGPPDLRVAVFNVWGGGTHFGETLTWLEEIDADVVVLQETMAGWENWLTLTQDQYPHQHFARCPKFEAFNVATLSKTPIVSQEEILLPPIEAPLTRTVVETSAGNVAVYNVHLNPTFQVPQRSAQDEIILRHLASEPLPYVFAGDFNASVWSPTLRKFEQESGLIRASEGLGVVPTWPVQTKVIAGAYAYYRKVPVWQVNTPDVRRWSFLLRPFGVALDHVYVSGDIGVVHFERGPALGSDHLPLIADLRVGAAS